MQTASQTVNRSASARTRKVPASLQGVQNLRTGHHRLSPSAKGFRSHAPFKSAGWQHRRAVATDQESAILTVPVENVDTQHQVFDQFDFAKSWYPAGILAELDPKRPHAMKLLGKDLVLWRDVEGKWRCFEDLCPHRKVSLSEGRIEPSDGSLQCSYHGWRFNGEGKCTLVPQIVDPKAQATACASPKSCATAFPTKEAQGLIWVWGSSGASALSESEATPLPTIPELDGDKPWLQVTQWYTREVPYSYDILLENVLDPAHLPFSHHGIAGNRNKPTEWNMTQESPIDKDKGFTCTIMRDGKKLADTEFSPPSLFRYHFAFGVKFDTYSVPTRPGWSRVFVTHLANPDAPLPFKLMSKIPVWFVHAFNQGEILDGDGIFLRYQEKVLRRKGGDWKRTYYFPASADAAVLAVRTWLDRHAGGSGPCSTTGEGDLPELSREVMLDRYGQHVKNCRTCQGALRNIKWLQGAAVAAAAVFVAAAAASAKAATGLKALVQWESGKWLAAAAAAALLYKWLGGMVTRFYFRDYVHADKS